MPLQRVMRNLVRRYVTQDQVTQVHLDVTEDDINEVKQNISTFKHELLNILRINGMKTGNKHHKEEGKLIVNVFSKYFITILH